MQSSLYRPFEVKLAATDTGEFEGHASVFNVKDAHGDVVTPGAFTETLAERKSASRALPPMFLMHGSHTGADPLPAGVWSHMEEDSKGLFVKGKISGATTTDLGKHRYELLKDGALAGLSIGWSRRTNGVTLGTKASEPKRYLKSIDLHEVSLVTDPSNALSTVTNIKASPGDVTKAASSIAAAIVMHDKTMKGGGDYYSGSGSKDKALLMDHLRDAHEALTGERAPSGVEGWTKSTDELVEGFKAMGLSSEMAQAFAALAIKAAPVVIEHSDPNPAEDMKSLLGVFSGFKMPKIG